MSLGALLGDGAGGVLDEREEGEGGELLCEGAVDDEGLPGAEDGVGTTAEGAGTGVTGAEGPEDGAVGAMDVGDGALDDLDDGALDGVAEGETAGAVEPTGPGTGKPRAAHWLTGGAVSLQAAGSCSAKVVLMVMPNDDVSVVLKSVHRH